MMTETVVTVQEAPRNNAANKQQQQDQNQGSLSWLRINLEYYKTIPGIIKLVQLVSPGNGWENVCFFCRRIRFFVSYFLPKHVVWCGCDPVKYGN